jgi:hypothetical protein
MPTQAKIIGVYLIEADEPVHLMELVAGSVLLNGRKYF